MYSKSHCWMKIDFLLSFAPKRPLPTLFAQAPWKALVENTERGPRPLRGPSCTCHSTNGSKDSSGTTDMQKDDALLLFYFGCVVSCVLSRSMHPPTRAAICSHPASSLLPPQAQKCRSHPFHPHLTHPPSAPLDNQELETTKTTLDKFFKDIGRTTPSDSHS